MTLTDLSKFHEYHQTKMEPKSYDIKITALSVISITPYHIIEQHTFIFILIISLVNKRMTKLVIIQSCFLVYQYHTALITIVLPYNLKSLGLMPSALFFFLTISLIIRGLFWFHVNFKDDFPTSVKNATGILIRVALNL